MATGTDSARRRQIVFVCTGNTCRSPMAEGLARQRFRGVSDCEVLSAGLHAEVGARPSPLAVKAAAAAGADISGHRVRSMTDALAFSATLLLALSPHHADEMRLRFPFAADKIRFLGEFAPAGSPVRDIPDPFGGSPEDYRRCLSLISKCLDGLAAEVSPQQEGRSS